MQKHEINAFLSDFEQVRHLAEIVRASVNSADADDSTARFIRFDSVDGEPLSFRAVAFQGRFTARFELVKQIVRERSYMVGQYAFFQMVGDREERLQFSVKLVPTTEIFLPNGNPLEVPDWRDEAADRIAKYQAGRIKEAISEALLSHVIESAETWTRP